VHCGWLLHGPEKQQFAETARCSSISPDFTVIRSIIQSAQPLSLPCHFKNLCVCISSEMKKKVVIITVTKTTIVKTILIPLAALLLFACKGKPADVGEVNAWVPVYSPKADAEKVTNTAPQPFVNGGKIATLGNTLYQVEQDKGIHIINVSNPAIPVKTGFISIALCRELTLKGNYLYTNNMADLVVLDVSNTASTPVTSRISNAFPDLGVQFPPDAAAGAYFECADGAKGVVIRWELKKITNPKCRR
jgi:hypothetical protein